ANVSFDYTSTDGTALVSDSDYSTSSGSHIMTPGQISKTITVVINGDTKVEMDETFTVDLSSLAVNGRDITFSDDSGLGTITNDDAITIDIVGVSQDETDSGQTTFTFDVDMSTTSDAAIVVNYATADGTALVSDSDYDAASGIITFNPGETSHSFDVMVNGDTKVELDEVFTATITENEFNGRNVSIGTATVDGDIINDDSAVITIASDITQNEGDAGTTDYDFVINMSYPSDAIVTVDYQTADVTANAGSDYNAYTTTTLTFNPGEVSKTITVDVLTDLIAEPDETFTFSFDNLVNNSRIVTIGDNSAIGTIWNDDSPTSFAGADGSICQNDTYSLADATATNHDGLLWETSGDGTFTATDVLNPVYTPGTSDITAGTVTLSLTASGMGVNISDAVDQMVLEIRWVEWVGGVSSDWHDSNNWCATVPTIIDQVYIPASAVHQPIISNNTGEVKDITLEAGASLGFANNQSLEVYKIFINNGTINAGSGAESIIFRGENCEFTSGGSTINNIEIDEDDVDANLTIQDELNISGDINFEGDFVHNNMNIILNGSEIQNVNVATSSINNLIINNTYAGDYAVILQSDLNITGHLTLADGVISTGIYSLAMEDGSSSDFGSLTSFVDGNMTKAGGTAFTFPTGDITMRDFGEGPTSYTVFAPFGMTPVAPTTVAVRYEYSNDGMPQWWYHVWTHEAPLNHTTDRENWLVSSEEDLQNVTLYWRDNEHTEGNFCTHGFCTGNPAEHSLSEMTVAYWDNIWKDAGGVATATATDVHDSGSISASNTIPFSGAKSQTFITFASKSKDSPLPIELIRFEIECDASDVLLNWATASEMNNDYFIIERSINNKNFKAIATIDGQNNSNTSTDYQYTDVKTKKGTWYYRLVQVDIDGSKNIVGMVAADCYSPEADEIVLMEAYPNPFRNEIQLQITSENEGKVEIELVDETGKTVLRETHYKTTDQNSINLYPRDLKPAMYYLKVRFNEEMHYIKLIRQ
ncbi:MAG: Calx-beta domain-containing protein, partial [Bacteroidota bacterium]|nr:Calx-beta domain-containing protein [Bacteroidota bacterium]